MLYTENKENATRISKIRNKPLKVSSLPDIQMDKILSKSNYTPSRVKDSTEADFNLALSNTSNSSRYKCDELLDIRSPTTLNESHLLSFQKSVQVNQTKHNLSKLDLLSKLNDEKPNLIKIVEELAEEKHINSKQKNEINILNQKIKSLKKVISMKNHEIEVLNKNHRDMMDKFLNDNQNYQKLNAEYFVLQDSFRKQNITFKSTINILVDIIDIVLISSLNTNNNFNFSNSSVLEKTVETISYLKNEEKKKKIVNEIKNILINNLSYIKTNLNIDLEEELQKIKNWEILPPLKPLVSLDCYKKNKQLSEDYICNFENIFSPFIELSPKFSQENETGDKDINGAYNSHSIQLMSNFNGSLRDLEIIGNSDENNSLKEDKSNHEHLHFNKFNNTPTEFNIEMFIKNQDISYLDNKNIEAINKQKNGLGS